VAYAHYALGGASNMSEAQLSMVRRVSAMEVMLESNGSENVCRRHDGRSRPLQQDSFRDAQAF
jgi:hypothetical protein